jgi:hypothetical protein
MTYILSILFITTFSYSDFLCPDIFGNIGILYFAEDLKCNNIVHLCSCFKILFLIYLRNLKPTINMTTVVKHLHRIVHTENYIFEKTLILLILVNFIKFK